MFLHGNRDANLDLFADDMGVPRRAPRDYHGTYTTVVVKRLLERLLVAAVTLLHIAIIYFMNFHIYLSRSRAFLFGIIVAAILVMWQWYVFGNCVLLSLENRFAPKSYSDGTEQHYVSKWLTKLVGEKNERAVFHAMTLLPVVTTVVAVYRLSAGALRCR